MGLCCEPSIAEIGDCDHVMTQVRFANDAICVIDNSRSTPHQAYDQRAELFGTEGCITVGNEYPNTAEYMDVIGQHRDKPLNFFMERYAEAYLQEMLAWVQHLVEIRAGGARKAEAGTDAGTPALPLPSGFDGRIAVVMAMAARRSFELKRPVRITEIDPSLEPIIEAARTRAV
jgi:myo-inositol 2-dehydrogenase/D-chiro-inositol 1-dehydrogenase